MSYSTVFDFPFDRTELSQWSELIKNTTPDDNLYSQHDDVKGMFLDILMFRDLPEDIHVSLCEATGIAIDRDTHSVGIETVKPFDKVDLHRDFSMGWQNPFARKCNVMLACQYFCHKSQAKHGQNQAGTQRLGRLRRPPSCGHGGFYMCYVRICDRHVQNLTNIWAFSSNNCSRNSPAENDTGLSGFSLIHS